MYSSAMYDWLEELQEFGSVGVTYNYFSYALAILLIVARWFIYVKAGEEGWASLIPFYNHYVLYKVSGRKKLFLPWILCAIACYIAGIVAVVGFVLAIAGALGGISGASSALADTGAAMAAVAGLIAAATGIAVLVFDILQCVGLSQKFNLSAGWAVGFIFLPHIFYSIVAFSKKYQHVDGGVKADVQAPVYGQAVPPTENPYAQPVNPYAVPTMDYPQGGQSDGAETEDNSGSDSEQ